MNEYYNMTGRELVAEYRKLVDDFRDAEIAGEKSDMLLAKAQITVIEHVISDRIDSGNRN